MSPRKYGADLLRSKTTDSILRAYLSAHVALRSGMGIDGLTRSGLDRMQSDSKNQIIGIHTVSVGSLFAAIVSPREVFKAAILANAASIIVAHNHPSGDVTPSPEDIQVTKTLRDAGKLLDIEVLDHVIVGEDGAWTSLKRLGHL